MTLWDSLIRFPAALWNVAGLLVLLVLFSEFGVGWLQLLSRRIRYGKPVKPDERATTDAFHGAPWAGPYFAEISKIELAWAPFVQWRQQPFRGTYITIDDRNLRATPGEAASGKDAVRVYCFGASTMFGVGARADWTIPAVLQRRLTEAGRRVSVTNCSQLGYNSSQELIALQQLLKKGDVPQVAVFYDGIADILGAEWSGRAGTMLSEEVRVAEFNLLRDERRRDLILAALIAAMPRTLRRLRKWTGLSLRGPFPPASAVALQDGEIAPLARAAVALYAANVRMVRALAETYGFKPLFFWQPVITTKKVKTADELKWENSLSASIAARRRFFAAVLEEYRTHPDLKGAPDAADLSAAFDDRAEPVYIDICHLSEEGNAAIAEAMLPAVTAAVASAKRR